MSFRQWNAELDRWVISYNTYYFPNKVREIFHLRAESCSFSHLPSEWEYDRAQISMVRIRFNEAVLFGLSNRGVREWFTKREIGTISGIGPWEPDWEAATEWKDQELAKIEQAQKCYDEKPEMYWMLEPFLNPMRKEDAQKVITKYENEKMWANSRGSQPWEFSCLGKVCVVVCGWCGKPRQPLREPQRPSEHLVPAWLQV